MWGGGGGGRYKGSKADNSVAPTGSSPVDNPKFKVAQDECLRVFRAPPPPQTHPHPPNLPPTPALHRPAPLIRQDPWQSVKRSSDINISAKRVVLASTKTFSAARGSRARGEGWGASVLRQNGDGNWRWNYTAAPQRAQLPETLAPRPTRTSASTAVPTVQDLLRLFLLTTLSMRVWYAVWQLKHYSRCSFLLSSAPLLHAPAPNSPYKW